MGENVAPGPRPATRRSWSTAAGFGLGLVVASILVVLAAWLWFVWTGRTRIDLSRPTVVQHVQQLHRLETVAFSMDKIVTGGFESRILPRFLSGDRILLLVYGDVTAGVDLSHLDAESLEVRGRSVRLILPPAELFATRIDNEKTRVYSRDTGLFTAVDPNLESEVRRAAEKEIRQAALDGGLLTSAAANARATLGAFLRALGFESVDVQ